MAGVKALGLDTCIRCVVDVWCEVFISVVFAVVLVVVAKVVCLPVVTVV